MERVGLEQSRESLQWARVAETEKGWGSICLPVESRGRVFGLDLDLRERDGLRDPQVAHLCSWVDDGGID